MPCDTTGSYGHIIAHVQKGRNEFCQTDKALQLFDTFTSLFSNNDVGTAIIEIRVKLARIFF